MNTSFNDNPILDLPWQHPDFSDEKIDALSTEQVYEVLTILNKKYNVPFPKGYDIRPPSDLKEEIREISRSEIVRKKYYLQLELANEKPIEVNNDGKLIDRHTTLTFFEKKGLLYLDVITNDGEFQFVYLENNNLLFDSQIVDDSGLKVLPVELPIHHDTGTRIPIVGLPRADLIKEVPLKDPIELYTAIELHISKYADLPVLEREMCIYYALYSWFYLKCPTSPYLRFIGDTGKGKSRILEVISDLCFYPIKASGGSSSSGIMRFHEKWKGTLVIDESDLKGGADNPLIKFLNTGFEKEKYLILSDKTDPKKQQIFDPFGPKVIAMREPFHDNATEGRCISYSPYETSRRDIPPELPSNYQKEVDYLRACITRFVLHNWQNVKGDVLIEIDNINVERRLLQMARPVSMVLQLFPDGMNRFKDYINKRQDEIRRIRAESWEGSLFNTVLSIAMGDEIPDDSIPTAITAKMIADATGKSKTSITRALTSIGFEVELDRIPVKGKDGVVKKKASRKLVVPSPKAWDEIISRYYYSEDDAFPPICPENIRGKHWLNLKENLMQFTETVTSATSVAAINVNQV